MLKKLRSFSCAAAVSCAVVIILSSASLGVAMAQRDVSRESARASREWVRDGVVYEIFPRSFSAEGDFNGVTARLDDLKNLGVTILWLMPIHITGQEKKKGTVGSPYAVRDYYSINPAYGKKDDLKRLIRETHQRGMKIIIDIVANHTSWDSVMMKTPEYYKRDASGKIISPYDWTDVAALNYENPRLRQYMIEMLKYWIREFDLDGFRCDVAGEVPTDFWEAARAELEKIKPDIALLAEASKPDLLVKAFDFDYAWPFHSALTDVAMGNAPATVLRKAWEDHRNQFPRGAITMRFSDNHDERRAISRFGERGALAASAMVLTLDGVPLLYNGMEVGDATESGAPALFEKVPVFWKTAERRPEFPNFYKKMIALRHSRKALTQGETVWLRNSDDARVVTYLRRGGGEDILVAINFSNRPFEGSVEVENGAQFADITPTWKQSTEKPSPQPKSSLPVLKLDSWGIRVYSRSVR